MRRAARLGVLGFALCSQGLNAQEAASGLDLWGTLSGQGAASSLLTEKPRYGSPATAGFRSVFYPTWKISEHWTITGALQLNSRPYFYDSFRTTGYGVKGYVLQATVNYSRVSDKGSLLVRVGQLSTAFGSFPLRYDDAKNALIDMPLPYGYYWAVSSLGVAGAQVDGVRGRWDGRLQFANSSPANPRSIFAHDQYGNWAGGGGYTIRQGLRVGASAYRGPYLDRTYPYFFPGEANPNTLPASATGADVTWSRGHWNVFGEWGKFTMPYKLIHTFHQQAMYAEVERGLTPRWYGAVRTGYMTSSASTDGFRLEAAAGYRPNRFQLIKLGYEYYYYPNDSHKDDHTAALQVVTNFHLYAARN